MDSQVGHGHPARRDHRVLAAQGEDLEGDHVPVGDLVGVSWRETRDARRSAKRHGEEGEGGEQGSVSVHGVPPEGVLCARQTKWP